VVADNMASVLVGLMRLAVIQNILVKAIVKIRGQVTRPSTGNMVIPNSSPDSRDQYKWWYHDLHWLSIEL